jgi:hypothetical protein
MLRTNTVINFGELILLCGILINNKFVVSLGEVGEIY